MTEAPGQTAVPRPAKKFTSLAATSKTRSDNAESISTETSSRSNARPPVQRTSGNLTNPDNNVKLQPSDSARTRPPVAPMDELKAKIGRVKSRAGMAPVERPKPANKFESEVAQARRRFQYLPDYKFEEIDDGKVYLEVSLPITDPEFPFEMDRLLLCIVIPPKYPDEKPRITVHKRGLTEPLRALIDQQLARAATGMVGQMSVRPLLKFLEHNLEAWMISTMRPSSTIKFVPAATIKVSPKGGSSYPSNSELVKDQQKAATGPKEIQPPSETQITRIDPLDVSKLGEAYQLFLDGLKLDHASVVACPSFSLSVNCARCTRANIVSNIRPCSDRISNCAKCTRRMVVSYLADLAHLDNPRIGAVICDGCSPFDVQPFPVQVTCENCCVEQTDPTKFTAIIVEAKSASQMHVSCPGCHHRMEVFWDANRWKEPLRIHSKLASSQSNRHVQKLAITPGQPLPDNGTCEHYRKSFRWYRFPCCNRVYPCDRCHDADRSTDPHEMQWATRVICGRCSKEQSISQTTCSGCQEELRGAARATSHWEGGKGTRDQAKMDRKDAKKYVGLKKVSSRKK